MARSDATSRHVRLVKAHAYGNDFLIVEAAALRASGLRQSDAEFARRVCDRHRGFGADGLLITERRPRAATMRLLNADGSPSEVSGNGLRCLAAWVARSESLQPGAKVTIDTDAGPKQLELLEMTSGFISGQNDNRSFHFVAEMGEPTELRKVTLPVGDEKLDAIVMRVGNPQCVVLGPATEERLAKYGLALATHPFFPAGTNVEFAEVVGPAAVRILIWERGVGPTESSGTGTCAAAVAAAAFGGTDRTLDVTAPGGTQRVEWTDAGVRLTGWAELVGELDWWLA